MICDECRNIGLCKFKPEAIEKWDKVEKEKRANILSPIVVEVRCKKFEKQWQRQDGIWLSDKRGRDNGIYSL